MNHIGHSSPRGGLEWRWAGWWLAAGAFYLLIYGKLDGVQVLVGLTVGGLAAALVTAAERLAGVHFAPGAAQMRRLLWPIPLNVLRDSARVLWASARMPASQGVRGRFQAVPFEAVENTPRDAAWRALAVLEISLAPNALVIHVDCEKRRLLVHQFLPDPSSTGLQPDREQTP